MIRILGACLLLASIALASLPPLGPAVAQSPDDAATATPEPPAAFPTDIPDAEATFLPLPTGLPTETPLPAPPPLPPAPPLPPTLTPGPTLTLAPTEVVPIPTLPSLEALEE